MDFKHSLTSQLEEFCWKPDSEEPLVPPLLLTAIPTGEGLWGFSQEQNSKWDLSVGEEPGGQPGAAVPLESHVPFGAESLGIWSLSPLGLCHEGSCPGGCGNVGSAAWSSLRKANSSSWLRPCFLLKDFPGESPQKSTLRGDSCIPAAAWIQGQGPSHSG